MRRLVLAASFAAAALLAAPLAHAQSDADKGQARELGEQGFAALDARDYARAEELFRRADALYHAPTLLVGMARAEAAQGKYVEAWEAYHRVVLEGAPPGSTPTMQDAVENARREIDGVAAKRARVTITVQGADAPKVTIDGAPLAAAGLGVERFVNPGTHAVHAEAEGMRSQDVQFAVKPGEATTASITLVPGPAAPPPFRGEIERYPPQQETHPSSTMRTLGWVSLGVGAAGLVTGSIAGLLVLNKHSDLANNVCPTGTCDTSHQSDVDSYHTLGTISTVGFIAGGVLAATGAVLLLTAPKEGSRTGVSVSPYVGAASFGARGTF